MERLREGMRERRGEKEEPLSGRDVASAAGGAKPPSSTAAAAAVTPARDSDWGGSRRTFYKVTATAAAAEDKEEAVLAEQPTELIQRSRGGGGGGGVLSSARATTVDQSKRSERPQDQQDQQQDQLMKAAPETLMFCPLCVDTVLPSAFSAHFATVSASCLYCKCIYTYMFCLYVCVYIYNIYAVHPPLATDCKSTNEPPIVLYYFRLCLSVCSVRKCPICSATASGL